MLTTLRVSALSQDRIAVVACHLANCFTETPAYSQRMSFPNLRFVAQDGMGGNTELVNVVYLDNMTLELYHRLLDKHPNATTYRITCDAQLRHVTCLDHPNIEACLYLLPVNEQHV